MLKDGGYRLGRRPDQAWALRARKKGPTEAGPEWVLVGRL
jgi:hypothetical protein